MWTFLREIFFITNKENGLFVSILCYALVTLNCILKIAPGSFGIAPGSCQIPVNQAQFWNANCSWFPPSYFKAWCNVHHAPNSGNFWKCNGQLVKNKVNTVQTQDQMGCHFWKIAYFRQVTMKHTCSSMGLQWRSNSSPALCTTEPGIDPQSRCCMCTWFPFKPWNNGRNGANLLS